ncbi:hypothetical protein CWATWH0402_429 [Crocosphaera watsonii WH 0402]|uniref:Uncharacterized protein n=2 Tax=Crocosphaera watsonii TaxID=263511 RepID=T2JI82_CROWT|nr:hypothetical protein CWATWH0005_655 [Crocosphaera watsonii WH 0005]CCQ65533.1 hypothetical protein CWATWH0402_429 [Crocosphaera watsonii WH 0402]
MFNKIKLSFDDLLLYRQFIFIFQQSHILQTGKTSISLKNLKKTI